DRTHVRVDTNKARFVPDADRAGVSILPLFHDDREDVVMEQWDAGAEVTVDAENGAEVLVISGAFDMDGEGFTTQSWLRMPKGDKAHVTAGSEGARVWIKRDHLKDAPRPPAV
ncbi:MAG: cupin domain-containing protein, partial [Pseudomonadota bacterium]